MKKIYIVSQFMCDNDFAKESVFTNKEEALNAYGKMRDDIQRSYEESVKEGRTLAPVISENDDDSRKDEGLLRHTYYYYFSDGNMGEWGFIALKEAEIAEEKAETIKVESPMFKSLIVKYSDMIKADWKNLRSDSEDMSWVDKWVENQYRCLKADGTYYNDYDVLEVLFNCSIARKTYLDNIFCEEVIHTDYDIIAPREYLERMSVDEIYYVNDYVASLDYCDLIAIYNNIDIVINRVRDEIDAKALEEFGHTFFNTSRYLRMPFSKFAHEYGCKISEFEGQSRAIHFADADPDTDNERWYSLSYEPIGGQFRFAISGLSGGWDRFEVCPSVDDIDDIMLLSVAEYHARKSLLTKDECGDYYVWIDKEEEIQDLSI